MASARAAHKVADGFAKPKEAAAFLGVGIDWLYELVRTGSLSHMRHGRKISIPWSALREYAARKLQLGKIA